MPSYAVINAATSGLYLNALAARKAAATPTRGYGNAAPGGRVKLYGVSGYAGAYPSAAAAAAAYYAGGLGKWLGAAANPAPAPTLTRGDLRAAAGRKVAPLPIAAPTPKPTVIVVFDPATVHARLARRARGLPPRFYRVRNKRRGAPTSAPPAAYPPRAALGVPPGFSLAA